MIIRPVPIKALVSRPLNQQTINQGKALYSGGISWEASSTTTIVMRHNGS